MKQALFFFLGILFASVHATDPNPADYPVTRSTAHFRIHYTTQGTARIWDLADLDQSGTPDYVDSVGQALENAYTQITSSLGMLAPSTTTTEVYLAPTDLYNNGEAIPGFVNLQGLYIVLENDFGKWDGKGESYYSMFENGWVNSISNKIDPYRFLRRNVGHEVFHLTQARYHLYRSFFMDNLSVWFERYLDANAEYDWWHDFAQGIQSQGAFVDDANMGRYAQSFYWSYFTRIYGTNQVKKFLLWGNQQGARLEDTTISPATLFNEFLASQGFDSLAFWDGYASELSKAFFGATSTLAPQVWFASHPELGVTLWSASTGSTTMPYQALLATVPASWAYPQGTAFTAILSGGPWHYSPTPNVEQNLGEGDQIFDFTLADAQPVRFFALAQTYASINITTTSSYANLHVLPLESVYQSLTLSTVNNNWFTDNNIDSHLPVNLQSQEGIVLALPASTRVACIALYWSPGESGFPYQVWVSEDNTAWTLAASEPNTDGARDVLHVDRDARYVKLTDESPYYNPRNLSEIALLGTCPDHATTPVLASRKLQKMQSSQQWRIYSVDGKQLSTTDARPTAAQIPSHALVRAPW